MAGMSTAHPMTLAFEVRDYECDLQGIVNNAVYQHYLEHARHQFLKRHGLDFAALTRRGIHLVVVRAELHYKAPLRSGDRFTVASHLQRLSPVRVAFLQEITRTSDGKRVLTAQFDCAAMDDAGKPMFPKVLEPLLDGGSRPAA